MKIAVICAMQLETDRISEALSEVRSHSYYGRTVREGLYAGHEIYLGVCGVGKSNAASFTQLLLDRFGVEMIINVGVAGSLDDRLAISDIVLGNELYYHDFARHLLEETYPYQAFFKADPELLERAAEAVPEGVRVFTGPIATGDQFVDNPEKKEAIRRQIGALACEMEGAAVAQVAAGAGIPFLILRSISDGADEGLEGAFERFKHQAAAVAAESVLALIRTL